MLEFGTMIGKTKSMKKNFEEVKAVAKTSATVLLFGETGTGKELIAKAIHNESERKGKPFVAVNCAAIPETLLESELFGHEKGSFTGAYDRHIGKFEAANGGTIFLDEIGSLPKSLQGKILRALQDKVISRIGSAESISLNVRIISATNSDLKKEVDAKRFRDDLYYRLNVVPINIPPLRERREDIPLLIGHFLAQFNKEYSKKIKGFEEDAMEILTQYDWPGNVRELENVVERIVALAKEDIISKESLPKELLMSEAAEKIFTMYKGKGKRETIKKESKSLEEGEKESIRKALKEAKGNKIEAAKTLGIHRNTLTKKIKQYGLE